MADIVSSAREHALQDLRRARAGVLSVAVGALAFGAYVVGGGRFELLALVVAALATVLATPSWTGVEPRYPIPRLGSALWERVIRFATPVIGAVLIGMMITKGSINLLGMLPVVVIAAVVHAIYAWRGLAYALARVRGDAVDMPLLARLWRHYLGYAAAFVAGGLAFWATVSAPLLVSFSAFAGSALTAKLLVDLALPQPLPKPQPLSLTFLNLMLMSPLWFGLPWGLAFGAVLVVLGLGEGMALDAAVAESSIIVLPVAVGSVAVFALLTLLAAIVEFATGEG
jgi:hypothetical protein